MDGRAPISVDCSLNACICFKERDDQNYTLNCKVLKYV